MPPELKKARGTFDKHREALRDPTVVLPVAAPPMPKGMPAAAKRRWDEIVPELLAAGVLAKTDGGALEAYCRSYARWLSLESAAFQPHSDKGLGVEARKLHGEVIQPLETALGLHFAARSRMNMPKKPEADAAADFLFKGTPGEPPDLRALPGGKAEGAEEPKAEGT